MKIIRYIFLFIAVVLIISNLNYFNLNRAYKRFIKFVRCTVMFFANPCASIRQSNYFFIVRAIYYVFLCN